VATWFKRKRFSFYLLSSIWAYQTAYATRQTGLAVKERMPDTSRRRKDSEEVQPGHSREVSPKNIKPTVATSCLKN
jgi:hypothetical protein